MLGTVTAQMSYDAGFPLTMNYYFMLAVLITLTIIKFGDKRVEPYEFIIPQDMEDNDMTKMTP
jgi:p-aminobenzoyl-glutamate transporter AbgT